MSVFYIIGDDGAVITTSSVKEWVKWFETHDRTIALDKLPTCEVSTIFLGIDHAFGEGPSILWETMVFGGKLDGERLRYTSERAALAGHHEMVDRCRREG